MITDYYGDDLIKLRIIKGDEKAFSALFYAYKDKLYNFLYHFTKSETKAEDLLQEVFMKVWQARDTLSSVDNLNAYIFKIAQNMAIDQLRRMAKDILYITETLADIDEVDTENPSELLLNSELKEIIHEAIEKLPPQQQKIFTMRYFEGWDHEKIASELNISVSTSQNHMRQALVKLRVYLLNYYQEIILLLISTIQTKFFI